MVYSITVRILAQNQLFKNYITKVLYVLLCSLVMNLWSHCLLMTLLNTITMQLVNNGLIEGHDTKTMYEILVVTKIPDV